MLKKLGLIVVAGVAGLLIYASTKPNTFRIVRSTVIQAPPQKIFPLINDFHRWGGWSPWEKMDPAMKQTFSSPAVGKGASYAWEGNRNVGSGRMEILESTPPSKILIQLDFIAPMKGRNATEFTLQPQGGATQVTWTMSGPTPFLSKIICTFVNMDRMVGQNFETGLANLKALAEKRLPLIPYRRVP